MPDIISIIGLSTFGLIFWPLNQDFPGNSSRCVAADHGETKHIF
jgi:hypothetical protein